jgi:hypothetical protein
MDRRKDQIILVKKWYACLIAGCVLRIEGELRQEPLARRIAARDLLELNEVRAPRGGILVNALEMGFVPEARALKSGRPAGAAGVQVGDGFYEGPPVVRGSWRRGYVGERSDWVTRPSCGRVRAAPKPIRRPASSALGAETRDAVAQALRCAKRPLHYRQSLVAEHVLDGRENGASSKADLAVAQSMNAEVTGLAGVDLSYIEEPMQRDGACLLRSALRQCRCGRSRSGKF